MLVGRKDSRRHRDAGVLTGTRPYTKQRVLGSDEVHVWSSSLDISPDEVRRLGALLSPDETHRAGLFQFGRDRHSFLAARGQLRLILSSYAGVPADRLQFEYSDTGKPRLPASAVQHSLEFNLSHSSGRMLVAITRDRAVGIDIERIRDDLDVVGIARHHFSTREFEVLLSLPLALRSAAFFECWTRKEAAIKARGGGLHHPLDGFSVVSPPCSHPHLPEPQWDRGEVARFALLDLAVEPAYASALAIEGEEPSLVYFSIMDARSLEPGTRRWPVRVAEARLSAGIHTGFDAT
jgi:4'-phosphopantetheinyl transferase